jgi:hypothetical protein
MCVCRGHEPQKVDQNMTNSQAAKLTYAALRTAGFENFLTLNSGGSRHWKRSDMAHTHIVTTPRDDNRGMWFSVHGDRWGYRELLWSAATVEEAIALADKNEKLTKAPV